MQENRKHDTGSSRKNQCIFFTIRKKELSEEDALRVIDLCNRMDARGIGTQDYKNYIGGLTNYMFHIEFRDGTAVDVTGSGQFYLIDGLGYSSYIYRYDAEKGIYVKSIALAEEMFDLFVELSEKYFNNDIWP